MLLRRKKQNIPTALCLMCWRRLETAWVLPRDLQHSGGGQMKKWLVILSVLTAALLLPLKADPANAGVSVCVGGWCGGGWGGYGWGWGYRPYYPYYSPYNYYSGPYGYGYRYGWRRPYWGHRWHRHWRRW